METEKLERGLRAVATIRDTLARYKFVPGTEEYIKNQVVAVLGRWAHIRVLGTEVINDAGRWDILVEVELGAHRTRVVLELKVKGTVAAVEAQAQRYAGQADVDAVAVVTTSSRLSREIAVDAPAAFVNQTLGGKPFGVIFLRTSL